MTRTKIEELIEKFVRKHQLQAYWCHSEEGEIRVQFLCEEEEEYDDE